MSQYVMVWRTGTGTHTLAIITILARGLSVYGIQKREERKRNQLNGGRALDHLFSYNGQSNYLSFF